MVGQVALQQALKHNEWWSMEHGTGHKRTSTYHIEHWSTYVANHRLSHEKVELSRSEPRVHLVNEHGWARHQLIYKGNEVKERRHQALIINKERRHWRTCVLGYEVCEPTKLSRRWPSHFGHKQWTFVTGTTGGWPAVATRLEQRLGEVKKCWGQHGWTLSLL